MKYLVIGAGGTGGCIAPGAGSCGCGSPPAPPGNLPDART